MSCRARRRARRREVAAPPSNDAGEEWRRIRPFPFGGAGASGGRRRRLFCGAGRGGGRRPSSIAGPRGSFFGQRFSAGVFGGWTQGFCWQGKCVCFRQGPGRPFDLCGEGGQTAAPPNPTRSSSPFSNSLIPHTPPNLRARLRFHRARGRSAAQRGPPRQRERGRHKQGAAARRERERRQATSSNKQPDSSSSKQQ